MIRFNKLTMRKTTFNCKFGLSGDGFTMASCDDDGVVDEGLDARCGMECWVLNVAAESYMGEEMVFVYIPEFDMATTVLKRLTN